MRIRVTVYVPMRTAIVHYRAAVGEANANGAPADVIIFELTYPAVIELTEGSLDLTEIATSIIGSER